MYKIIKILVLIFFGFLINTSSAISEEEKIKVGLLVPLTGDDKKLGQQIIKSTRIALKDINTSKIEIFVKDTNSNPNKTVRSAIELKEMGIKIVIGPVFYKSLAYLNEITDITFLSLTNKTLGLPNNVISTGINAASQINAIKNFIQLNKIDKTIFLTPKLDYEDEIKKAIKQSKIKISKHYFYDTDPTKLTAQIEKITNYKIRKQNLQDEIRRVENSDLDDKERQLEKLNKKYTIGNVRFNSIIIADFDESLKSVTTSLLYTDVSPKKITFISLNQWFDETLFKETTSQPITFPSINKKNYDNFREDYYKIFNEYPNQLSMLSYDLVGLTYYLLVQNSFEVDNKLFLKKNKFKGISGVFEIKNKKINHILNFYKVEGDKFIEIF